MPLPPLAFLLAPPWCFSIVPMLSAIFEQLKSLADFEHVNLLTVYQQENNVRVSNKIT